MGEAGGVKTGGRDPTGPLLSKGGPRWSPLVPLAIAVSLGILVDCYADPWETSTWAALGLGAGAAVLLANQRDLAGHLAILAAFVAVGGGWHHHRWSDRGPDDLGAALDEAPRPAWVRGRVVEMMGVRWEGPDRYGGRTGSLASGPESLKTRFVVDLTAVNDGRDWRAASGRAIAIATGDSSEIEEGEGIEATGRIAAIAGPLNPGEFDYRRFVRARGIDLRLTIDEGGLRRDPDASGAAVGRWVGTLRARARRRLMGRMTPTIEPLAAALLLGRREGVDPEVDDAFARTGTTHLLAISGMHMQVLALALVWLTRLAGLPRRPALAGVAMGTVAYAILVGPAPSVVRSAVMTVTFCLAAIVGRMTRPSNILALAALGTLAVNPLYLFDVGCQLSFLAIAALVWLVPPAAEAIRWAAGWIRDRIFRPPSPLDALEREYEPPWRKQLRAGLRSLGAGVLASTVVWLSAVPLVALRFHIVSPIGILLNIPLIPITSAALLLGGLGMGLSAAWGPMGVAASQAAGVLLDLTRRIVLWGVAQPWGHRFVAGPWWAWVAVFYVLLALSAVAATSWLRRRRAILSAPNAAAEIPDAPTLRRLAPCWLLSAWCLVGAVLAVLPTPPRTPEAEVLAVGHGLAVIVHTPDDRVMLYDCGRLGDPSVGRRIVAPALWERGLSRIDEVILSHADQDHYDGLPDLLDRFTIGRVRIPPGFGGPANPSAESLLAEVRSRGIPVVGTAAPESWGLGGVRLAAIHPPEGWFPDASDNARSLVLDVDHRGRHLLLTGDLEQTGLIELLARPRLDPTPEVLLAPHHGGKTANPESLYRWAAPRIVVVSQRPPRAGTRDPLAAVEEEGIPLWRTWRDGAIRLRWADAGIVASGYPSGERSPAVKKVPSLTMTRSPWPLAMIASGPWPIGPRLMIGLSGFLLGAIVWVVVTIVEFGAWTLVVPPRGGRRRGRRAVNEETAPEDVPTPEPIEAVASDGVRLAGRWYPSQAGSGGARTILLLHGFAEDPSAWEGARAALLTRRGWNVAMLDLRCYGRSGGMLASFGGRESGDVSAWLDALSERMAGCDGSNPSRFAAWGRSMGAAISLRAAADDPRIGAVVLEAPMVDLHTSVAALLRKRGLRFTRLLARLILRRASTIAGVPLANPSPVVVARRATCRALIVHGEEDWLVIPAEVARLAAAFPTSPARIEVPGAGHSDVIATGGDALTRWIAEFLDGEDCSVATDIREATGPD